MSIRRLLRGALHVADNERRLVVAVTAFFGVALAGLIIANVRVSRDYDAGQKETQALRRQFALLSQRQTDRCSLASVDASPALRGRLQGSCCSPMVFDRYVRHVVGLRAYAHIHDIPADPYDVTVRLARRLTAFNRSLPLRPGERKVYDQAIRLSDEHGPCCCPCWRWLAFEGLARELIARREWGAQQVAAVWDLEDGCGGGGQLRRS